MTEEISDREKQVLAAYLNWSESEVGIIMLRDLQATYDMQISHTAGDPCTTAFREGERAAGWVYPRRMIARAIELLRKPMEGKDNG